MTISRIPNKQVKKSRIPCPDFGESRFLGAVKSRIPSRYLLFSRFSHCVLVKSWIPRIPFQTLAQVLRVHQGTLQLAMFPGVLARVHANTLKYCTRLYKDAVIFFLTITCRKRAQWYMCFFYRWFSLSCHHK